MEPEGGLVLSSTSVNTWLDCHLQWYFRYVLMYDSTPSEAISTGIAVHEHAEMLLKQNTLADGSVDPEVIDLIELWKREVKPQLGITQFVEAPYRIEVNGIAYQSILDVVDEQGAVRDLKTTRRKPRPGRYQLAMIGHALGSRSLTGTIESDVVLDYLVRTRVPYYSREAKGGPVTDDEIDVFAGTLAAVADGIDREEYDATGLDSPWACAVCPYKSICGPRQRYEENQG